MKLKFLLSCLVTAASLFAKANNTTPGKDADPNKKNDINGGVYHSDTKKPLGNVNVTAYSSKKEKVASVTNSNGNYGFDDLKPGMYKFVFEKDGYKRVVKDHVFIKTDDGFQMNIEMKKEKDFNFMPSTFAF